MRTYLIRRVLVYFDQILTTFSCKLFSNRWDEVVITTSAGSLVRITYYRFELYSSFIMQNDCGGFDSCSTNLLAHEYFDVIRKLDVSHLPPSDEGPDVNLFLTAYVLIHFGKRILAGDREWLDSQKSEWHRLYTGQSNELNNLLKEEPKYHFH